MPMTLYVKILYKNLLEEAGVVNMYKGGHEELAVKPVHDASMAGDCVTKVLKYMYLIIYMYPNI